jgi:hypothetical protein
MNASIDDDGRGKQSIWGDLPSFVERGPVLYRRVEAGRTAGHDDLDRLLGELYADAAVKYAREIKDPAFVGMVMAAIYFKTTRGHIKMGSTEQGFLSRIARLAYVGSLS